MYDILYGDTDSLMIKVNLKNNRHTEGDDS